MSKFYRCCREETEYRGSIIFNGGVNLEIVTYVKKVREMWYPDNDGTPAIEFRFVGGNKMKWIYNKSQEDDRDADYERIMSNLH